MLRTLSERALLSGLFLTPFSAVTPLSGVGFSVGDMLLVLGAAGYFSATGRLLFVSKGFMLFAMATYCIAVAILLSLLFSPTAGMFDAVGTFVQYALGLLILPLVLATCSDALAVRACRAFVFGGAISVALGVALLAVAPSVSDALFEIGWMRKVHPERHGLFTGVGELSKMVAMSLPLIYWVWQKSHVGYRAALLMVASAALAVIVSRSNSGFIAVSATCAVLLFGHALLRVRDAGDGPKLWGLIVGVGSLMVAVMVGLSAVGIDFYAAFVQRVTGRWAEVGIAGSGSAEGRLSLAGEAWGVIAGSPVVGVGHGQYPGASFFETNVHVAPLLVWAEYGVLGPLAWLMIVSAILVATCLVARRDRAGVVVGVALFVAFLITSISVTQFYPRIFLVPLVLTVMVLRRTRDGFRDARRRGLKQGAAKFDDVNRPGTRGGSGHLTT